MYSTPPDPTVARTILQQLGGPAFLSAVQGKVVSFGRLALTVRVRKPNKANAEYVEIALDEGRDLYNVVFADFQGETLRSAEGVYCDQLGEIIERMSGIACPVVEFEICSVQTFDTTEGFLKAMGGG